MGQYYYPVNLDRKQFIHPHKFSDGLKLTAFGASGEGTMFALAVLLSDGNGRGGGDVPSYNKLIGSWAGDRIVIAGDYADKGKFIERTDTNLHCLADEEYQDISQEIIQVLLDAGERISYDTTKVEAKGQPSPDRQCSLRPDMILFVDPK